MHPILFKFGVLTVYSYGAMIALAFLISSYLAWHAAKEAGLSESIVINSALVILFSGIAGARLLYVAINISSYIENPIEIIMLPHGGLAFYGGAIAAVIAESIYLKVNKISVYKFADFIAPYVAFGQAIGRIGCLLNGCCYGRCIDAYNLYPTQLYSSFLLVCLYCFLRLLQKIKVKRGIVFVSYGLLYSAGRFMMEFLRGDNTVFIMGLTFSQFVSVIVFPILAFLGLRIINDGKNPH